MTTVVTVTTGDQAAHVYALPLVENPAEGEFSLQYDAMATFGTVPPHSEIEFSVFNGQDILVRPVASEPVSQLAGALPPASAFEEAA